jgi:tRNA A-37 threonylcarbamoyl transferase component Bud32
VTSAEPERVVAGRYRLEAVIGRGGMGAIWRAHDELLDRDVALKELIWPPELDPADREVARSRAVREAQLAARLRHPNVVGIYDIVEDDGRPCIVMELVPFRSLRDTVIEDGPMTSEQAARVGLQVLAALRAVHGTGVVHRDVKPSNILLSPEGRVVLTDFGIARAADSTALTGTGVLMGSPSFVAPERARGGAAEAASDLWALGALLYTAVEARPPFERGDALSSLTAVVTEEPDRPAQAGLLWPVIEGLLRKDPAERLGVTEAEEMLRRAADADASAETDADAAASTGADRDPEASPGRDASAGRDASVAGSDGADRDASADRDDGADRDDSGTGDHHTAGDPAEPGRASAAGTLPPAAAGKQRWRLAGLIALAVAAIVVITVSLIVAAQGPGGSDKAPATRASAASSPPATPSRAATSAASASATSSPAAALPAGYYRFTNSTGFSIGVPRGWQISHVGHYVYIRDPANSGIFLLIDQSDQPKASPLSDWEQQAASRQGSFADYHLIRIQAVPYAQAIKAADWQFTYDRDGIQVEVLNRNILADSHHAYALYWSTPLSDWTADYHYFEAFAATFRPA